MIGEKWIKDFRESMNYIDPLLTMQDLGACVLLRMTGNKKLSYSLVKSGKVATNDAVASKYFGRQSIKTLLESGFMDSVVEEVLKNFAQDNSLIFQRAVIQSASKLTEAKARIEEIESEDMSPQELKKSIEKVIRDASEKKDFDLMLKAIDKLDKLFPVEGKQSENTHIMILPPKNNTICPHCNRECLITEKNDERG